MNNKAIPLGPGGVVSSEAKGRKTSSPHLAGERRSRSTSRRLRSSDRLRALLTGDLVREGEWLFLAVLSAAGGERRSLLRGEELGCGWALPSLLRPGERFSLPEDASLEGDLAGFLSLSLSASGRLGLPSLDLERRVRDRARCSGDLDLRPPRSRLWLSSVCAAAAGGDGFRPGRLFCPASP